MCSVYTSSQLSRYLEYLSLPSQYDAYQQNPHSFPKTAAALKTLFRCQITRFPYENLTLHYSGTQIVDINPTSIFEKVMGRENASPTKRGGYCLEVSIFFNHVLRGLGFDVYMTGVRNRQRIDGRPQGEYRGWTHIVNIVRLPSGSEYHVDVAFGGDGPVSPLPLVSGEITRNLGNQEVRLVHDNISKQSRAEQKVWTYQYRNAPDKPWNAFYCFAELEFFLDDFEVINRFTSWEAIEKGNVVVKFIRNKEIGEVPFGDSALAENANADDEIYVVGKLMMVGNVVKVNMGGRTRVVDSFQTKEETMAGIRKWFSISF